jgi:hypothetical protein
MSIYTAKSGTYLGCQDWGGGGGRKKKKAKLSPYILLNLELILVARIVSKKKKAKLSP